MWDSLSAGTAASAAVLGTPGGVGVTNGLFTVICDFGAGSLPGAPRWLELAVRTNGSAAAFTTVTPRQSLPVAPYAVFATTAGGAAAGVINNAALADGAVTSAKISGTLLPNQIPTLDAAAKISGTLPDAQLSGNVALLNRDNTFSAANTFAGTVSATDAGNVFRGTFVGDGVGLVVPGTLPYRAVAGTAQAAAANTGYLLTNAALTTATLPNSANVGDLVRVLGTGTGGWQVQAEGGPIIVGGQAVAIPPGGVWTARENARSWSAVASSTNGNKLVAAARFGDFLYTSADAGATWTARDSSRDWLGVASSADGTKLVAVDQGYPTGGMIYTSTDSGVNWTPRESSRVWQTVASAADGTKLVAVASSSSASPDGERIYTSTDSGVTWTARATNQVWVGVASSADGTKLVAAVQSGGIYTSADSGVTWTLRGGAGVADWKAVASSGDGTKLLAVGFGTPIFVSTNSGVSWTARVNSRLWTAVASSTDASTLAAVEYGGQVYISADAGVTWTARESNRSWTSIAVSGDGGRVLAGASGEQLYSTSAGAASRISGRAGTAAGFQYLGNGVWQPVVEAIAATNVTGTLADARLSANVALLNGTNNFTGTNRFAGFVSATNGANQFTGAFTGSGAGLTNLSVPAANLVGVLAPFQIPNLDAAKLTTGTLADARLSANVALLTGTNNFTGTNRFAGVVSATNAANQFTGTFTGSGAGLTNLSVPAANLVGVLAPFQIPNLDAAKLTTGTLATVLIPNLDAAKITTGTFAAGQIPNLDTSKLTTGTLADARLSANVALLNGTNNFTGTNRFAGVVSATNAANQFTGTFTGSGAGLTNLSVPAASLVGVLVATQIPNLDAAKITTGTLADARLSAAIARQTDVSAAVNTTSNGLSLRLVATNDTLTGSLNSLSAQLAASAAQIAVLTANLSAVSNLALISGGGGGGGGVAPSSASFVSADPLDPTLVGLGLRSVVTAPAPPWLTSTAVGVPGARSEHSSVWTGQEMIVWGGRLGAGLYSAAGAAYRASSDAWQAVSPVGGPSSRSGHAAVWTGQEMIVWGGFNGFFYKGDGARYSLSNQLWNALPTVGAPSVRDGPIGVWTGARMIVWGGRNALGPLANGALYDPTNNTWTALSLTNSPAPRAKAAAVWAGDRLLLWGGEGTNGLLNTGAQLLFVNGTPSQWSHFSLVGAPPARLGHTAVWTGSRFIIWGGAGAAGLLGEGAAYDPIADTWTPLSTAGAPTPRTLATATWTGAEMVLYGGETISGTSATGAAYDPASGKWRGLTNPGAPTARSEATAVWTGGEILLFGGRSGGAPLAALQRLTPQPTWYFFRKP